MGKSRRGCLWFLVAVAALAVLVVVTFAFSPMLFYPAAMRVWGVPNEDDRHQVATIIDAVLNAHHFAHNSISDPGTAPVFGDTGSKGLLTNPTTIYVYDVTDRPEQDNIITAVRSVLSDNKFYPVELVFLDHENWIVEGDLGKRGPETQIRRVRVTSSGARDEKGKRWFRYTCCP